MGRTRTLASKGEIIEVQDCKDEIVIVSQFDYFIINMHGIPGILSKSSSSVVV